MAAEIYLTNPLDLRSAEEMAKEYGIDFAPHGSKEGVHFVDWPPNAYIDCLKNVREHHADKRVMVIDYDPSVIQFAKDYLNNCTFYGFRDENKALEQWKESNPDVVIIGSLIPETGFEVASKIRRMEQELAY